MKLGCLKTYLIFLSAIGAGETYSQALEDKSFVSDFDGTEQRYIEILPARFDGGSPHHLIVALHGHGSDRWQYATQERDECNAFRDFALRHGMVAVCPDYRAKTSWMNEAAERDVLQIIRHYKSAFRIEKVYVVGGSMGGTGALTFAALHPDLIDGVTAMNPLANHLEYERFQDAIALSFGGGKRQVPEEYKKRSAEYWPERFVMPVAVTVGMKDTIVPPQSVIRLVQTIEKIRKGAFLLADPEGGHETNYADATRALEYMYGKEKEED